jgi:4-hydroxy-2-oxoglutarate aldolase
VELYRAAQDGDYEGARGWQRKLALLVRGVMGRYGIGGIKAAMDEVGYEGGRVRAPLPQPDENARAEISRLLKESGVLDEEMNGSAKGQRFGAGAK